MATLPEKFARAQGAFGEILRRFNLLRDVVRPWTDVEGKGGIKVTVAEANVVIDAQELASRIGEVEAAVATTAAPFTLYDASSGGTLKVGIRPGMVNNFVPTIGGTSLVAVPTPSLTVTGSTGIIYLDATVDAAGAITALIIANATSIPADTATQKRKLIGTWTASGGAFTSVVSILDANQTLYLCNGTAIWEA
jgi:hypothetical protein